MTYQKRHIELQKIIQYCYLIISLFTLCAAAWFEHRTLHHLPFRDVIYSIFRFSLWIGTFIFINYFLFFRQYSNDKNNTIYPVLIFNLITLYFYYFFSFDLGFPKGFMRVSYLFGNFADFLTMSDTYVHQNFLWINTGHFPFSYAIGKWFAHITKWRAESNPDFYQVLSFSYLRVWLIAILSLMPLAIYSWIKSKNKKHVILAFAFLATSSPFFVMYERGNLALITFAFLSLICFFYLIEQYWICAILIGMTASTKSLNLIFFVFLFSRFEKKNIFIGFLSFAIITIGSLYYLFGTHVQQWTIFMNALIVPFHNSILFTDATNLFLTTGIESFRSLIHTLLHVQLVETTTQNQYFNKFLLLMGLLLGIYFYIKKRKLTSWYHEFVILLCIPMVFHPCSGDYNLGLLIPFWLIMVFNADTPDKQRVVNYISIAFLLLGGISIGEVSCCGVPGRSLNISPKGAIVPFMLLWAIITIIWSGSTTHTTVKKSHHNT